VFFLASIFAVCNIEIQSVQRKEAVVKLFIDIGMDTGIADDSGLAALELATLKGHSGIESSKSLSSRAALWISPSVPIEQV
jgi:hypothetical protein